MNKFSEDEKKMLRKKRKLIDKTYNSVTLVASLVGLVALIAIFIFVFIKGSSLVSWELITGDYYGKEYHLVVTPIDFCNCDPSKDINDNEVYSSKWGITLQKTENKAGEEIVLISHIEEGSPLNKTYDINNLNNRVSLSEGVEINYINFTNGELIIAKQGIDKIAASFNEYNAIDEIYLSSDGGGIRSSLISTLYLIFFSLLFALPIGIFTAIYLNEYAKKGLISNKLRKLIEMLTGVPSIIFGLVGLVVFIPITSTFGFSGRNLIAASLTLAIIILPTIIRSTEESLKVIPSELRQGSLALGANNTQTTFKVVLPNALPGILTAILLGIGRIIGESAALIFVLGTVINDNVSLDAPSTTLAVHIWSIMGGEVANFELASAISIIILAVVLVLNLIVKLITYRINKIWH